MNKKNIFIVIGVMLAMVLSGLDQTIVASALPQVASELNGLSQLSWVFTAYMLTSVISVPIWGKLSDIFGYKKYYIIGIIIFVVGSALSGISQNMTQLILFRGLQGIGSGSLMMFSTTIIGDIFPPAERGKWQGLLFGVLGLSTIAGPLLGGWISDNFSWRWIFFINLPLGIIAIIIAALSMPKVTHPIKNRSIDFSGAIFITLGLLALLLAFTWGGSEYSWLSWQIISLFGLTVVFLMVFVFLERKAAEPLISPNLFKNKVFVVSGIVAMLSNIGMYGAIVYIPTFAQGVVGASATNSGLILLPMMVSVTIGSIASGQIISRTRRYKILTIIALIVSVLGMFFFTQIGISTTNTILSLIMVVLGLGLGFTLPVFNIAVQNTVGQDRLGEATAGVQLLKGIGGTVGTAVLGGVMNSQLAGRLSNIQSEPFVQAFNQLDPSSALSNIDVNSIESILSNEAATHFNTVISQAPSATQPQLIASFNHFIETVKSVFSISFDHVFIVDAVIMSIALIAVLFLPDILLRKSNESPVEEIPGKPRVDQNNKVDEE